MLRWLFLGLLAWTAYRLWRHYNAVRQTTAARPSPPHAGVVTAMVKCAHCELHVPEPQAVYDGEHWFCCTQHKNEFRAS
jgi:uncharacterized protein